MLVVYGVTAAMYLRAHSATLSQLLAAVPEDAGMRVGYLAAAWSIVYAVVLAADPSGPVTRPVAMVLGALGVCVALVMAAVPRSGGRAGLLAFAWGSVLALVVEGGALAIGGALAWAATAVVFQRRSRGACVVCGRADSTPVQPVEPAGWAAVRAYARQWATPVAAARWGAWSVGVAVAIPGVYLANRWPWNAVPAPMLDDTQALVPRAIVAASALPPGGAPVVWFVWVAALAASGYAWHLRRRGPCARCGRSEQVHP